MKKKDTSPLLWLLPIPLQLILGVLFTAAGALLDSAIFSGGDSQGHGIPVFTALFFAVAAAVTLAVFILAPVLAVRSLRRRARTGDAVSAAEAADITEIEVRECLEDEPTDAE